jgi:hypothetical protein
MAICIVGEALSLIELSDGYTDGGALGDSAERGTDPCDVPGRSMRIR